MTGKTLSDLKLKHDPATIIAALRAELKEAQSESTMAGLIREAVGIAAKGCHELNLPSWVAEPATTADAPGVPNLLLSDFHWGERVSKAQVNGVNEFDMTIARARLKNVIQTSIHLLRILDPQMRYPGIVVKLGGDMVSGNIHDELQATNEMNTMPTLMDLYRNLVPALSLLADTFGQVFVPCVSGNHDRDTKKTWSKDRNHTSFGWLLYQFLAERFQDDKRFTFYIPEGPDALYRVYNTTMLLTHGDQFRGGDGIIGPIGPLMRGNQKKQQRNAAVDQSYDIMECGHWHQRIMLSHLIVNSSLKGYDEYAAANNFRFEPPSQNLWTTHADYGVNWTMPVFCDRIKARKKTPWVAVPTLH